MKIIARGFGTVGAFEGTGDSPPEINGFVSQITRPPSWAKADTTFRDSNTVLTLILRRGDLLAVHCDSQLKELIQRWLDKEPLPAFRRVPSGVLQAALLTGEAKSLWLRGAHARRTTKPDAKSITGQRLQDALNPMDDGTFAMGSARSDIDGVHPELASLTGVVGTTPRKALVWLRTCEDFEEFVDTIIDLLSALQKCIDEHQSLDQPFPWLATEVTDLTQVSGAYEVVTTTPENLDPSIADDQDAVTAADTLARAAIVIDRISTGADFIINAGINGKIAGHLRCMPVVEAGGVQLRVGSEGAASDPGALARIRDAIRDYPDLLTIYYQSNHAIINKSIWSSNVRDAPFLNWRWSDFSPYDIALEKPKASTPQDIHDRIAIEGDQSLFSWVVGVYASSGWLTCDDGSGEVADFVHLDSDGTVELIHVKGATSAAPARRISASAYEVVASQASKNLRYLDTDRLATKLATSPPVNRPGTWYNGHREANRDELVEFLRIRGASDPLRIVIIQPHVRKSRVDSARSEVVSSPDGLRLKLIETLLNSARSAAIGLGADLTVVADGGA